VALTITDLDVYKRNGAAPGHEYPTNLRTFYSPIDDVHGALKAVIGSCQRSLVLAMYGYDDDELAELVAHLLDDPAIHCQITLDKSQAGDGLWRISGSTNWSTSGETMQDNELTVCQSAAVTAEARAVLDLEHTKALTQMAKAAAK
jgi:hypothetical protein